MKLFISPVLFMILFSCNQKLKNTHQDLEIANELNSIYFSNEFPDFSIYSKEMRKESKNTSLNMCHNLFCLDKNIFMKDTIYNSSDNTFFNLNEHLDNIFSHLNESSFTEICFFSKGFLLDYYDKAGNLKFQIEADSAIQYTDKNFIELKSDVIFSTPKNKSLITNNLYWDISNETVWTYDSIIIKNIDTIQGRGCGLFSADNLQHYKTYGVEGKYNLLD